MNPDAPADAFGRDNSVYWAIVKYFSPEPAHCLYVFLVRFHSPQTPTKDFPAMTHSTNVRDMNRGGAFKQGAMHGHLRFRSARYSSSGR